jgi:hypothetical protein
LPFQFLRTDRRAWLALALLFLASLPAVTTRIYASDEAEYFSYLRSLWFDHDVSFENEYRYFDEHGLSNAAGFHETFLERRTPTGLRENWGTIGCAILWAPFYALGDLAARGLHAAGWPVEVDGFSKPYIAAVCYGSACYGFLALLLSAAAARLALGDPGRKPRDEWLTACALWFGTPLLFYMYVSPPFSHACSAFAVAAFVVAWLRVRETWSARGLVGLGLLGALMTMVREQDAFYMAGPALDFAWALVRVVRGPEGPRHTDGQDSHAPEGPRHTDADVSHAPEGPRHTDAHVSHAPEGPPRAAGQVSHAPEGPRHTDGQVSHSSEAPRPSEMWRGPSGPRIVPRLLLNAAAGAGAFALAFVPQALAYLALNGRVGPSLVVSRKMYWWAPHALQVLFSPEHGLFFWTPLALLAVAGLLAWAFSAGRRWPVAAAMVLMFALQVYVSGSVDSWSAAGAFGHRRFVGTTVVLAVGFAALLRSARGARWRTALAAVVLVCAWWNVSLMIQFGTGLMNRQQLELSSNVRMAFVEVPARLPGLAWRYLFDRTSFYAPPGGRPR